jgi:hypothetical protein
MEDFDTELKATIRQIRRENTVFGITVGLISGIAVTFVLAAIFGFFR